MRPLLPLALLPAFALADTIPGQWFFSAYATTDNPPVQAAWVASALIDTTNPAVLPPPGSTAKPKCFELPYSKEKPFTRSIINVAGDTMLCSVKDQLVPFFTADCSGTPGTGVDMDVEVKKEDGKTKGLSAMMTNPGPQDGWRSFQVKKCPPRPGNTEQATSQTRKMRRGWRMLW